MLQKQATITTFELHSLNIICHKVNRIEIKQTTAPRVCNNSLFAKKKAGNLRPYNFFVIILF